LDTGNACGRVRGVFSGSHAQPSSAVMPRKAQRNREKNQENINFLATVSDFSLLIRRSRWRRQPEKSRVRFPRAVPYRVLLGGNDKQTCGEATLPWAGDEERDKTMTPNNTFTTPLPVALPPVPGDVFAFAAAQGAAIEDVQCVLTMTRRLFPTSPLSLRVRQDSADGESYIAAEVEAAVRV